MPNNNIDTVISLVRAGLTGEKFTLSDDFNIDNIYTVAKKHQMMNVFLYGALSCGINDKLPVIKKLYAGAVAELALHERQTYCFKIIAEAFNANNISYMPLKGILLKSLYAKPEMRVMSDMDILIKTEEYDRIKAVLNKLNFIEAYESDHELVWKRNGITIELHKHLIPSYNDDFYSYFGSGWERAIRVDESRFALDPNDEFIFVFTHFAKHYRDGGVGIKQLTDLWLLIKNNNIDFIYVQNELEKLHLRHFYLNIRKVIDCWFGNGEADDVTAFISEVIIKSGVYGTENAHIDATAVRALKGHDNTRTSAKAYVALNKLFPSAAVLSVNYKYLEKMPILLPVAWVSRWTNAILFHREKLSRSIEQVKAISSKKTAQYEKSLKYVGLDFNFKENK